MDSETISEATVKKRKFSEKLKVKKDLLNRELETLGINNVKTLDTENEVALLYYQAYHYDEALLYFKEVYYRRMHILGPNNLDTIATHRNIGLIYRNQGRLDEALNIFNEIYGRTCDILGKKHPVTQTDLCNVGLTLQKQKKYAKAFEMFNELEKSIYYQIAMVRTLYSKNNFEKALEFCSKIRDKVLQKFGPEAIETLNAKHHIGEVLTKLSRWEEALPIYKEVVEGRKKYLGPFHGDTLSASSNYGVALYKLGNIEEALDFLHKVHLTAKKVLGHDNESCLGIRFFIGYILKSEGRYYEFLQFYYDILNIQTSKNPDHTVSPKIQLYIADIYVEQGKDNEAFKIYDDVYEKMEEASPKKSIVWNKMVSLLRKQGNNVEFLKMHRERYEKQKECLGPEDPSTLTAYESLGEAYFHLKKLWKALKVFSDVFSKRRVILGIDHTDTLRTRQRMADTIAMQHHYAEATLIYKEIYNIHKYFSFTEYTYDLLTNLALLLCLQEKYTESLIAYEERASIGVELYGRNKGVHILNDDKDCRILYKLNKLLEEIVFVRSPENAFFFEIQNAVAEVLQEQELYKEALTVYENVRKWQKTHYSSDPDHPALLISNYNVGSMYYCLGKFKEAVEILQDVYTKLKSCLGPEHPKSLDTQLQFAEALYNSDQLDAAIFHYLDMYWKVKKKLGLRHPVISKCEQGIAAIRIKLPKSKLVKKIMEGDFQSFLLCLEEQKGWINDPDAIGSVPLHYASLSGNIDFVKSLLKSGALYDARDKVGKKPLDYASDNDIASLLFALENFFISVKVGDDELVTKLIAYGIFIDAKDKDGNTGVHYASREGHVNIVKILVKNGADCSLKNGKGEVPIDVAISAGNSEIADILRIHLKIDSYLLSKLINEDSGNTPLHISARKGHLEILKELLRFGANPTDVNDNGYTPLHFAAYEGNTEIAQGLLKFVKEINAKKLKNFMGCKSFFGGATALEIASNRGFTDITKILVSYEANDVQSE